MKKKMTGLRPAGKKGWLLLAFFLTVLLCILLAALSAGRAASPQQTLLAHVDEAVNAALGTQTEVPAAQMGLLSVSHAEEGWYVDVLAVPEEEGGVCVWTARVLLQSDGGARPVSAEKLYVWPRAADA